MNIFERLKSETPKLIKKVQRITTTLGTGATVVTGFLTKYPELNVPTWIPALIALVTAFNHFLLQLTTHKDFVKK